MNLLAVGCSYRTTPVQVRERLAFDDEQVGRALEDLANRLGQEAVLLSTCNRVELYVAPLSPASAGDFQTLALDFIATFHGLPCEEIRPHLYAHENQQAVRHLFRVAASLDSLIVGEGQIAGQVKKSYERALSQGATGPLLNALFPHARRVAKRVRSETGISQGSVSVSSAAVEYVKGVFDHFGDKTVLVIGAGKMGELTLKHLRELKPRRILVTNRSPEKARQVAAGCHGEAVPWEKLDEVMALADVVLSTTGATEPIMTRERYSRIAARRRGAVVIIDIAVPRDFDPRIHDGDRTFLFNIDDLQKLREETLKLRRAHVTAAEAIVEEELARFSKEWAHKRNGPTIERLNRDADRMTDELFEEVQARLNGKLSEADKQYLKKMFHRLKNKFLHVPISALREETQRASAGGSVLLEAMRTLFRLE